MTGEEGVEGEEEDDEVQDEEVDEVLFVRSRSFLCVSLN
jgi:hypothetical protein